MNPVQRAALRALVQRLLPGTSREGLIDLLARRMAGEPDPRLADPVLEPIWAQPEALGWAYQYAQEEAKDQVFARLLKQGQKVEAGELPVVTQLFTPGWIVRFLVENSLGRLWLEMHPDSRLRQEMTYLLPASGGRAPEEPLPALAGEIRVLDPACGAMHFGLTVYDLLERCYREELDRAGEPGWPRSPSVRSAAEIPAAVMAANLYGFDIDPGVLGVARRALRLRSGEEPRHLYQVPAPLGALDRQGSPGGLFHVVLTNPPYMARKNAEPALAACLEAGYPEGKGDLYTAFLQRCLDWLAPGGRLGMVAQSSFMFIGSYEPLRRWLLERVAVEAVAHLGAGAFAEIGGEKVNTAAFLLRRTAEPGQVPGIYLRLLDGGEEEKRSALLEAAAAREEDPRVYRVHQTAFGVLPGAPWVYWLPPELRSRYESGERLADHVRFCRGITTADNGRFVRYWWEVGLEAIDFTCSSAEEAARSPRRWFPYMKGGGPVRWFGNALHVLDWAGGGRELRASPRAAVRNLPHQFREGVTYSSVTGGSITARWMPSGFLFDQASNALFPHDPAELPLLLALLNHPVAAFTVGFNPTVNIVEADLNRIPWPKADRGAVSALVWECINLARRLDQMNELSPYFQQPPLPDQSDLRELIRRLADREAALEELLDEGLGLTRQGRAAVRERWQPVAPKPYTPAAIAEAWISYALGILLGRCRPGSYGGGVLLVARWREIAPLVRTDGRLPVAAAAQLVDQVLTLLLGTPLPWELDAFLQRHRRTYRQRPVFRLQEGVLYW
ncbi:MAG: Eco57I restriction-modification methylase domain-containing protein [Bacillota bacterium]